MSANKKISQLPLIGTLDGTELLPIVQDAETRQGTIQEVIDLISIEWGGITGTITDQTDLIDYFIKTAGTSTLTANADIDLDGFDFTIKDGATDLFYINVDEAHIDIPLHFSTYGSVSETLGGKATIWGNSVAAEQISNNTVIKTTGDVGHFISKRYDRGIGFHSGFAGAIGTTAADTDYLRMLINNFGVTEFEGDSSAPTAPAAGVLRYITSDTSWVVTADGVRKLIAGDYTQVSATYTVLANDETVECTANTFTVTLHTAVGCKGKEVDITNKNSGLVTLDGDGTETIDGNLSVYLPKGSSIRVKSNGTNWIICFFFIEKTEIVSTTDATLTTIATLAMPASTTTMIEASIVARRTGGAAGTAEDSAAYKIIASYKNVAGTATEVGETSIFSAEDQGTWAATINTSSGNALIQVTGEVDNNINWLVTYRMTVVS